MNLIVLIAGVAAILAVFAVAMRRLDADWTTIVVLAALSTVPFITAAVIA